MEQCNVRKLCVYWEYKPLPIRTAVYYTNTAARRAVFLSRQNTQDVSVSVFNCLASRSEQSGAALGLISHRPRTVQFNEIFTLNLFTAHCTLHTAQTCVALLYVAGVTSFKDNITLHSTRLGRTTPLNKLIKYQQNVSMFQLASNCNSPSVNNSQRP